MTELSLRTRESFDAVMRKYSDMVYRLAYSRTGSTFDADDILQEVFLRYIRADKTYNDEEHRKSFLIRITINCTKSYVTSAWNRHRDFSEPDPNEGAEDPAIKATENKSDVMNALLQLPEIYRTAIYLFYYEDMSISQIAKTVKTTETNIKTRLSRGRDMLKEKLKEVEFDV